MKLILLIAGFLILISAEILRVYFIMPFPGSQEDDTIRIAYFIHNNIIYFRLIGLALFVYPAAFFFRRGSQLVKITLAVVFGFYGVVFYMFNYRFLADQMFLQPKSKIFLDVHGNTIGMKQLVLGVTIGTESKAYPIEIIGYHHQVRDSVGGQPIMVTYCTVCRTGRVFSPVIDRKPESFRLVGMDHYNAMFEDAQTKSWWRQANGEAIVGPMKGKMLSEIGSGQMSLAAWTNLHPDTKILQADSKFADAYKELEDYDEGKRKGRLERKDSLSWKDKSWIVAIQIGMGARAYDWIELQKMRVINDTLQGIPLLVMAAPDSMSFYSYNRIVKSDTLTFSFNGDGQNMIDTKTNSTWSWTGKCIEGALKNSLLTPMQAYQEYWHSWRTFHPQTTRYIP